MQATVSELDKLIHERDDAIKTAEDLVTDLDNCGVQWVQCACFFFVFKHTVYSWYRVYAACEQELLSAYEFDIRIAHFNNGTCCSTNYRCENKLQVLTKTVVTH